MRRSVSFAVGLGIFMTAHALGVSDYTTAGASPMVAGTEFGLIKVENLTDEQRAVLQAKYRHWSAAESAIPELPR